MKEREVNERDLKKKFIWIRTDNPSLAVKILNVTPRPILPSQKAWLVMASEREVDIQKDGQTERINVD